MTYVLDSKAPGLVVTLDEAKKYLRVDFADDDAEITSLIQAATSELERLMSRDILTGTWINYRSSLCEDLTLRRGGFQSLETVEILVSGVYQVVSDTEYQVRIGGIFGVICEIDDQSFDNNCNAIKITFKSGFGDTSADVPEDIKLAIKSYVAFAYENRGDCACSAEYMPLLVKSVVRSYSIIDIVGGGQIVCV